MSILAHCEGRSILPSLAEVEEQEALSFEGFIRLVDPTYEFHEHNRRLCAALQQVADGTIRRLLVSMPPRHGKSMTCSRLFPAYWLYRYPRQWVGMATYGADLSYLNSRESRNYYTAAGLDFARDSKSVGIWQTPERGGLWAAGAGGALTGKGFELGLVDDPVKDHAEALSPGRQDAIWEWWKATYRTRCNPGGRIVVIMTRWSEADLVGRLLEQERTTTHPESWTVLDFDALRRAPEEDDRQTYYPETCTVEPDWRSPGEALCPERYPVSELEQIRASVGSFWWSALYQGRPVPAEGGLFKRSWFQFGTPPERFEQLVAAWDLAFKDSVGSDYCAGVVMGRVGADFWVLEVVRQRLDAPGAIAAIQSQKARWPGIGAILVEDAANGVAAIQMLRRKLPGLMPVRPEGGKVSRASAAAPYVEAGNVWVPEAAPWAEAFLTEMVQFPSGQHDDQVDAFTYAVAFLAKRRQFGSAPVTWGQASVWG